MRRHAEIGSTCLILICSLKHDVVLPLLIMRDSGFLIKIFINYINLLPNSIFLKKTHSKKEWFIESNVFSIFIAINIP